jgi:antitoxin ParD1/3/4
MQLNVPPDLEALINKRLSSGGYASAEDVLRRALEAQDAEESWTDEERQALSAPIEQGFLQSERGELSDGAFAVAANTMQCNALVWVIVLLIQSQRIQRQQVEALQTLLLRGIQSRS